MSDTRRNLLVKMAEAEHKAWDSLARYKFVMFGYWCGVWVNFNSVGEFKRPNPWSSLVRQAKPQAQVAKRKVKGGQ